MGGQNHQPTRPRLTAPSAWLSQHIGDGFSLVLQANTHLEHAIIVGMDKVYVEDVTADLTQHPMSYLDSCIVALERSLSMLDSIEAGFRRLLECAEREGYRGNPLASNIDSFGLKERFSGHIVLRQAHDHVWCELESRIKSSNVLATLQWEAGRFCELRSPTERLIETLRKCRDVCALHGPQAFVGCIENNELPLRQHYAQVFSLWNELHAMFLYSALMMTELFYMANGFPSLAELEPGRVAARAA